MVKGRPFKCAIAVLATVLACATHTASATAAVGDLTFEACIADTNAAGCDVGFQQSLEGANASAVSPDGSSVYVVSDNDDSISHFTRAAGGSLTFAGCIAETSVEGCTVPEDAALDAANATAVSPDGKSVYVTSDLDDSISHFTRAANGSLTYQSCIADTNAEGCDVGFQDSLAGANGVAVSPDGSSVYVVSDNDDSISHFTRAANGSLTFAGCIAETNVEGCTVPEDAALNSAREVAVSPDGKSVYVTSFDDDSISHFTRAANGSLFYQSCIADTNVEGCMVPEDAALHGATGVAVSPDGGSVYVASVIDNSVSHFTRAANGSLTYQSCIADTNAAGCDVGFRQSLNGANATAVSPDGSSVYVTSSPDNSISHFTRAANGSLTFAGCIADTNAAGCTVPQDAALAGAKWVAVSPDSSSVYVTSSSDNSVSHFTREVAAVTPPDTTAPGTAKGKGPAKKVKTKKKKAKVRFEFSSPEAGVSFRCSLDDAAFNACTSPAKAKVKAKRKAKRHSFEVAAVDAAGNVDQTPAVFKFKVKRKRKR